MIIIILIASISLHQSLAIRPREYQESELSSMRCQELQEENEWLKRQRECIGKCLATSPRIEPEHPDPTLDIRPREPQTADAGQGSELSSLDTTTPRREQSSGGSASSSSRELEKGIQSSGSSSSDGWKLLENGTYIRDYSSSNSSLGWMDQTDEPNVSNDNMNMELDSNGKWVWSDEEDGWKWVEDESSGSSVPSTTTIMTTTTTPTSMYYLSSSTVSSSGTVHQSMDLDSNDVVETREGKWAWSEEKNKWEYVEHEVISHSGVEGGSFSSSGGISGSSSSVPSTSDWVELPNGTYVRRTEQASWSSNEELNHPRLRTYNKVLFGDEGGEIQAEERFRVGYDFYMRMKIKPRFNLGILAAVNRIDNLRAGFMLKMEEWGIIFMVDNGNGPINATFTKDLFCDGEWHDIYAQKTGNVVTLSVDNIPGISGVPGRQGENWFVDTNNILFLGAHPRAEQFGVSMFSATYKGCMKDIIINGKPLHMTSGMVNGDIQLGVQDDMCTTEQCF